MPRGERDQTRRDKTCYDDDNDTNAIHINSALCQRLATISQVLLYGKIMSVLGQKGHAPVYVRGQTAANGDGFAVNYRILC